LSSKSLLSLSGRLSLPERDIRLEISIDTDTPIKKAQEKKRKRLATLQIEALLIIPCIRLKRARILTNGCARRCARTSQNQNN
jgi:hypothetical protein